MYTSYQILITWNKVFLLDVIISNLQIQYLSEGSEDLVRVCG